MKNLFLTLLLFLSIMPSMAQVKVYAGGGQNGASLSVTASGNQKFWVFIDDVLQNEESVRSILIQRMSMRDYYLRVEIDNKEHNCVGQYVNPNGYRNYDLTQRNGFYGLVPVQGVGRPELTVNLLLPGNHHNGNEGQISFSGSGLRPDEFEQTKAMIENESFDSSKLNLAKQIVAGNMMRATQIAEVCKLFSFESNALEFAKYAYRYCSEPNKYYLVGQSFKYESSKRELNEYIQGK